MNAALLQLTLFSDNKTSSHWAETTCVPLTSLIALHREVIYLRVLLLFVMLRCIVHSLELCDADSAAQLLFTTLKSIVKRLPFSLRQK